MIKIDQIDMLSNMTEEDIYESFDEFNEVEFEDLYPEDLYFWLEGVFLLSVTCFGLIGNIALREAFKKKNCIFNDIDQNNIYPHPP